MTSVIRDEAARLLPCTLAEAERGLIEAALERCGGSTIQAARLLGISVRVIQYRILDWGLQDWVRQLRQDRRKPR